MFTLNVKLIIGELRLEAPACFFLSRILFRPRIGLCSYFLDVVYTIARCFSSTVDSYTHLAPLNGTSIILVLSSNTGSHICNLLQELGGHPSATWHVVFTGKVGLPSSFYLQRKILMFSCSLMFSNIFVSYFSSLSHFSGHQNSSSGNNEFSCNLNSKLLHVAWHPKTNLIACGTGNSLFLHHA